MKGLFIVNDPPYGTERVYSALRLAHALVKREPSTQVTVCSRGRTTAGRCGLAYVKPQVLKSEYSVDGHDDIFREMDKALERLTDEAIKPN